MKRSGQVGLAVMGVAAFAATYASVAAYRAGTAPTGAQSAAQTAAQTCTTRPDGTQNCEPARRGFSYYLLPHFMHGSSSAAASTGKPQPAAFANTPPAPKAQTAALTNGARAYTPAAGSSGAERGGFGTTPKSNFRVSAGG